MNYTFFGIFVPIYADNGRFYLCYGLYTCHRESGRQEKEGMFTDAHPGDHGMSLRFAWLVP